MTSQELAEIKQRWERTTAGPWKSMTEGRDHTSGSHFIMTGPLDNRGEDFEILGATTADQEFIAHSHQDVPRLLEEIERLKLLVKQNL